MKNTDLVNIALELLEEDCDTCEGVCHACGNTQYGVEPDAENYKCESCGENRVYGAQQTLLMLA